MALSSLPSKYGIGSLGAEAYRFVDFLAKSNQEYWQMLPLCPLGKGNSPYSSPSTFAGEILYIDLDFLTEDGLLKPDDIPDCNFSKNVDYNAVRDFKLPILKKAAEIFDITSRDFIKFKKENRHWLKDYALFMAIRDSFGNEPFNLWEDSLKFRYANEMLIFEDMHPEEILFYEITQYLFYRQFKALKKYAEEKGIKLIGDIPFYVSFDSADVWSNPDAFRLGRDMTPVLVAGVPPDIFSKTGQLWGNPVYDWDYHKKTNYNWWRQRLVSNARMYDVIRIDHFRAFADYYTVPFGAPDAKSGKWEKGMGMAFWNTVKPYIRHTEIIAEDLGGETEEVMNLIEQTGFPNMKVLQFAFDSDLKDPFLPKNYDRNCVCYTGTHDNDTTLGWYEKAEMKEKVLFSRLVPKDKSGSAVFSLIAYAMKSRAAYVIIPFQDYLQLPSEDRMNTPGNEKGNWEWRFEAEDLSEELSAEIRRLSETRRK